jgi:hypothetical protein
MMIGDRQRHRHLAIGLLSEFVRDIGNAPFGASTLPCKHRM